VTVHTWHSKPGYTFLCTLHAMVCALDKVHFSQAGSDFVTSGLQPGFDNTSSVLPSWQEAGHVETSFARAYAQITVNTAGFKWMQQKMEWRESLQS